MSLHLANHFSSEQHHLEIPEAKQPY